QKIDFGFSSAFGAGKTKIGLIMRIAAIKQKMASTFSILVYYLANRSVFERFYAEVGDRLFKSIFKSLTNFLPTGLSHSFNF
ncbi:MAG: hypothetical protein ACKO7R_16930, partial [Pseudanabaena sp.]